MKPIGKTLASLAILILALGGNLALGAIIASVDRDRVSMGDYLQLTITASGDEELEQADLRPLNKDFQVLGQSTSSNTSIINGRMSQSRKLVIELTPIREGNLEIPSLHLGQNTTASIPITVGAAPDNTGADQAVLFEAEVDQHSVYVQGQVILTLRIQQSVNLEGRNISELKLDNAFVKPLEQRSFQRTMGGRPWLVDEVRYAIFPEQSGTLEIPAQVFSGHISRGRRSFFDLGGSGQMLRRTTKPITIEVLPSPASFTAETWLPSRQVTLEERWSTPPEQLRVGESATRTIRIQGEGLQGAQLPPILFTPIDGLKYYPDQPRISEQEIPSGLEGIREDSAAVVPTRAGTYLIPEVRIPWWNTQSAQVEYAVLPEREIIAIAADPSRGPALPEATSPEIEQNSTAPIISADTLAPPENPLWRILAAVSTAGWLLTLIYLWRQRRPDRDEALAVQGNTSEKQSFKQLQAACTDNDAAAARTAVIAWVGTMNTGSHPVSLEQVATLFGDKEFTGELRQLDTCLYSTDRVNWSGARLLEMARRLRGTLSAPGNQATEPLRLYPNTR